MSCADKVFEYQARLSVELDKPLVIHLVKAMSELKLKLKIESQPWIIHGFRGESGSGGEYLRHGFISLWGEISGRGAADNSTCRPALFWKLDEISVPVADLYSRAKLRDSRIFGGTHGSYSGKI